MLLSIRSRFNKILFILLIHFLSEQVFAQNKNIWPTVEPCNKDEEKQNSTCGFIEVFEDQRSKAGRKIAIHFMILPAKSKMAVNSAFLFLSGAPGKSTIASASEAAENFRLINQKLDIVLVDLRGTGKSNFLGCQLPADESHLQNFLGSMFARNSLLSCKEKHEKNADLTFYTTTNVVIDLEEIRKALGYKKFNVYGSFYGSRVALEYLRRYPDSIRTAILDGTVPTDMKAPLRHPRNAQNAIEMLFKDCETDLQCKNSYPRLREEFQVVLSRLESAPARIEILHPKTSKSVAVLLSRDVFAEFILSLLNDTKDSFRIPLLIHKAFQNDFDEIVREILQYRQAFSETKLFSTGFFLSVSCAEDIPFINPSDAIQYSDETFLGDYQYRELKNACEVWPRGSIPSDFLQPIESKIPILLISGALDPLTPAYNARDVSKTLQNSLPVIIEHGSHSGWQDHPCVEKLFMDFVERASVLGLPTSCLSEIRRPLFEVQ